MLTDYLTARDATKATQTAAAIARAVTDLSAARHGASELLHACTEAQAAESAEKRAAMEQTVQTLGAIVRELSNAVQAARAAQSAYDQLDRVEGTLRTNYGGTP